MPLSHEFDDSASTADALEDALSKVLPKYYPIVVKPNDAQNHAEFALVFDEQGLRAQIAKFNTLPRLEQYIPHGGAVFKVRLIDQHHARLS